MSNKMKHLDACDDEWGELLLEFTEHADCDRWPSHHEASGKPKDGAVLVHISPTCTKTKAAAKILGLTAPCQWPNTGNRHETAAAVAGVLDQGFVFVRSSGSEGAPAEGNLHILLASDKGRKGYLLHEIVSMRA